MPRKKRSSTSKSRKPSPKKLRETELDPEAWKTLELAYAEAQPKRQDLARNMEQAFRQFLDASRIDVLFVSHRIKTIDSIRKNAVADNRRVPQIDEITDLCGIRIVCVYPSDMLRIEEIIQREFNVHDVKKRGEEFDRAVFGYRSFHFIVTIKDEWSAAPNYRELLGVNAEIQVRTILMHAWADLSHKLDYKPEEPLAREHERRLFQLSALFEFADEAVDALRESRESQQTLSSLMSQLDERSSWSLFEDSFAVACRTGRLELIPDLIERLRKSQKVLDANASSSLNMALALIDARMYDESHVVLDLGLAAHTRAGKKDKMFEDYYQLNKLQIKAHQGEEFSAREINELQSIVKDGSLPSQVGAHILLGNYQEAEAAIHRLPQETEIGHTMLRRWPIIRLLMPHIKNASLRENLQTLKPGLG